MSTSKEIKLQKKYKNLNNCKNNNMKKTLVGLCAGFISGLFAAGGGMIVVPALIHLFNLKEAEARATSIFCILPMVLISGIFYYDNNFIDWNLGVKCAIGGIIGGFIGSKLLKKISDKYLQVFFILFLIFASLRMILS